MTGSGLSPLFQDGSCVDVYRGTLSHLPLAKLSHSRLVDKHSRAQVDVVVHRVLNELKAAAPTGLVDIAAEITKLGQGADAAGAFTRLGELCRVFEVRGVDSDKKKELLSANSLGTASALFQAMQDEVKKQQDAALEKIWPTISAALGSAAPQLTGADAIREWMNNADNAQALAQVTQLSLGKLDLKQLPPEIGLLPELTELYLNNNSLIALPNEIDRLSNLSVLELRGNKFIVFPESILKLSRLATLDISINRLIALPKDIDRLANLTQLDIGWNKIVYVPDSLDNLINLDVSCNNNPFIYVPRSLRGHDITYDITVRLEKYKLEIVSRVSHNPNNEIDYTTESEFAKFYQVAVQHHDKKTLEEALKKIREEDRQLLFYKVWELAGKPSGGNWGGIHTFDDIPCFYQALSEVVSAKYPTDAQQQQRVLQYISKKINQTIDAPYKAIYLLNKPRLIDAIEFATKQ